MNIDNKILKHYLRNCYFINGTAYAGKSTMCAMLSPQAMSADRFFDRTDPEKQFLLTVIEHCPNPKATLEKFKKCIATVNSPERYDAFLNSGFFTLIRSNDGQDTREEMLTALATHFSLV